MSERFLTPAGLGSKSCADPGNFVMGVQVSLTKKALTTFFFFFSSLVLSLFLRKSNGQFQRNLSFFKVSEGVQHFPGGGGGGGGPTFSNCLFPIETHITCDFPGGVRTPCPPPPSGSALANGVCANRKSANQPENKQSDQRIRYSRYLN